MQIWQQNGWQPSFVYILRFFQSAEVTLEVSMALITVCTAGLFVCLFPRVAAALGHKVFLLSTPLTLLPTGWAFFFWSFVLLSTVYTLDHNACTLGQSVSVLLSGVL